MVLLDGDQVKRAKVAFIMLRFHYPTFYSSSPGWLWCSIRPGRKATFSWQWKDVSRHNSPLAAYFEAIFYASPLVFSDDGRTKPVPRPAEKVKMASNAKGQKAAKPRSESTSSHNSDPEYNCLIRALYHSEKISTVVCSYFRPLFGALFSLLSLF